MRTRKGVDEVKPSALLNHPSLLLYMVLKWAGLRRGWLFSSQIRVAKGVSVISVVNLPRSSFEGDLTAEGIFWYNALVFG